MPGVMAHTRNLVYCAPPSGGKSLVSDLLVVRRLIAGGCDGGAAMALRVLPFVSLCQERSTELTRMLKPLGIEVRSCFGGQRGALPPRGGAGGLIVATPEKANDLVTRLVAEDRIHELACVVVDELHMVQDVSRGSTVELMLTKLMHAAAESSSDGGDASSYEYSGSHLEVGARGAGKGEDNGKPRENDINLASPLSGASSERDPTGSAPSPLHVIGMSATLPNLDALADGSATRRCSRPISTMLLRSTSGRCRAKPVRRGSYRVPRRARRPARRGRREGPVHKPFGVEPLVFSTSSTFVDAGCTELDAVEALASETVRWGGGGAMSSAPPGFSASSWPGALSRGCGFPARIRRRTHCSRRSCRTSGGSPGRTYCTSERLINVNRVNLCR